MAEEFFYFGDFLFGEVVVFFRVCGVVGLQSCVSFSDIHFHAFLSRGHVCAEVVACGHLLIAQGVQTLRGGAGADVEFVAFIGQSSEFFG